MLTLPVPERLFFRRTKNVKLLITDTGNWKDGLSVVPMINRGLLTDKYCSNKGYKEPKTFTYGTQFYPDLYYGPNHVGTSEEVEGYGRYKMQQMLLNGIHLTDMHIRLWVKQELNVTSAEGARYALYYIYYNICQLEKRLTPQDKEKFIEKYNECIRVVILARTSNAAKYNGYFRSLKNGIYMMAVNMAIALSKGDLFLLEEWASWLDRGSK